MQENANVTCIFSKKMLSQPFTLYDNQTFFKHLERQNLSLLLRRGKQLSDISRSEDDDDDDDDFVHIVARQHGQFP